jgi:hypothetical protein
VEDGEEVYNLDNSSSGLNPALNTIDTESEYKCVTDLAKLCYCPFGSPIKSWPCLWLLAFIFMPDRRHVFNACGWETCFFIRRWVFDPDVPEVLVANAIGVGKMITWVAGAMISKLLTETILTGLLQ